MNSSKNKIKEFKTYSTVINKKSLLFILLVFLTSCSEIGVIQGYYSYIEYTERIINRSNSPEYDLVRASFAGKPVTMDKKIFSERFKKHSQFSEVNSRKFEDYQIIYAAPPPEPLDIYVFIDKTGIYQELIRLKRRAYADKQSCLFYVKYNTQTGKVEHSYFRSLENDILDCGGGYRN